MRRGLVCLALLAGGCWPSPPDPAAYADACDVDADCALVVPACTCDCATAALALDAAAAYDDDAREFVCAPWEDERRCDCAPMRAWCNDGRCAACTDGSAPSDVIVHPCPIT